MTISAKDWTAFVTRLSKVSEQAVRDLRRWEVLQGG